MKDVEVRQKAKEINDEAEKFVLSHAVLAVRNIIERKRKGIVEADGRAKKMSEDIIAGKVCDADIPVKRSEAKEFFVSHPIHIVVDYVKMSSIGAARIVLADNNYFQISVPRSLVDENPPNVTKLRKLVGHELGHFVLHFDDLLNIGYDMVGSSRIIDKEKEMEANVFSDEIILLREEHIRSIARGRDF